MKCWEERLKSVPRRKTGRELQIFSPSGTEHLRYLREQAWTRHPRSRIPPESIASRTMCHKQLIEAAMDQFEIVLPSKSVSPFQLHLNASQQGRFHCLRVWKVCFRMMFRSLMQHVQTCSTNYRRTDFFSRHPQRASEMQIHPTERKSENH